MTPALAERSPPHEPPARDGGDGTLTDGDYQRVSAAVYRHCGILLDARKRDLVRARIAREIREGGFASPAAYVAHALADPAGPAFAQFIDAISTNLTSFFREADHFDHLARVVLPDLLRVKRLAGDHRLRAWSAACSTGEEPYSLAMTLADALAAAPGGPAAWDVRLLATDISTRVLRAARAGVYPAHRLAGVPVGCRARYFSRARPGAARDGAGEREVAPELRAMIRFRHLNLIEAWPFTGPFDFIFCRNVMIYFDRRTQQRLTARLWDVLRPGGLLFTGHSESLTGIAHRFHHREPSVYEKV